MATANGTGSDSTSGRNEGEGSRSADKQYREGVQRFLKDQDPEALAKEAERDVDANPAEYQAAEAAGRQRAAGEDPEITEGGNDKDGRR